MIKPKSLSSKSEGQFVMLNVIQIQELVLKI